MGEVYRAWDPRLRRNVAIKVLPDELARDPTTLARFEREAHAVAALAHPNILDIHDFGHEGSVAFIVTELLQGETLRQRLTEAALPWRQALEIGLDIAHGLASAHEHGIVHRDLKPENVFLTNDGRVKILDFGLARADPEKSNRNMDASATLQTPTDSGIVMGTVGYMSPEQARGQRVDERADIFSLGCILYEMVTGRRAFEGHSPAEVLAAILREEPTDPADIVPNLPERVRLVIMRCLAKHPERRFQSARDLAFALKMGATDVPATPSPRPRRPRLVIAVAAAAAAALVVIGLPYWLRRNPGRAGIDSVAVLPFTNAMRDPEAEYLSEGITENLINSLSQLPNLRVPARATVFVYQKEPDPRKAGKALGVRLVLSGRVARSGEDVVVEADLIDVRDGSQLWGKRFPAKFSAAFSVQEAIAQEISQSLRLKLTGAQERQLVKRYTESAEAYDLYLKGRYHWNKRSEEGMRKAIEFFERAIARDPHYPLAFAGLADAYISLAFYGFVSPREAMPKAREAAVRALQLDDTIAEAHATLGDVRYLFDWDWTGAEEEFRRAIALNPSYATARQWYADYLVVLGRVNEAQAQIFRAQSLDPLNPVIRTDMGMTRYYSEDYAGAVEQYRKTLELDPEFLLAHVYLGLAHLHHGATDEAIREFELASRIAPGHPDPIALLGYSYAVAGRRRQSEAALQKLVAMSKERFISAFPIAWVHVGLGDDDRAFEWLERAADERAGRLVYLRVEHAFDPIRTDPRFPRLLERMRFPQPQNRGSPPA
jgi:serine/threonine-protein kinase